MNIRDSYIHGADGKGVVKRLFFATAADVTANSDLHVNDLVFLLADTLGTQVPLTIPTLNQNTSGYASSLLTVKSTSANNHYLTFVDSNNTTAEAESFYTSGDIYFKPSTGVLTVKSVTVNNTFNYSGISSDTTSNAARKIWFASSSDGTPVVSSNFKYNPSTKTLTVDAISGPTIIIGGTTLYLNNSGVNNKLTPDTSISNLSTDDTIPSSKAVWDAILNGIATNDAMIFKGLLTGGNTAANTTYTPAADKGYTYKVGTAGYINGTYHQVNDTFICTEDGTVAASSTNVSTVKDNWAIIEGNGDFLPLSGGTLTNLNDILKISSSTVNSWIYFKSTISGSSANRASVGYYSNLAFLANEKTYARIGVKDDGTPVYQSTTNANTLKVLLHTGNISSADATIGTSLTTIATLGGVEIKALIDSYAISSHTHSVKINGSTKTIAAPGGTAVDLGSYLPLTGGKVTGPIEISTGSTNNNYNEGLRITRANNNWAGITFGSTGLSGNPTDGWFAATNPEKQFIISPDSSSNTIGLTLTKNGEAKWRNHVIAHAGNVSNKSATIGTVLTEIATIAGVSIKAKVKDVAGWSSLLFSNKKTLVVDTWENITAINTLEAGTYAIQINAGTLYASGIFSACLDTDATIDEIPLHVSDSDTTWRPYARVSANNLQMTTNEVTGVERTYTIKILKLI